MFVERLTPEQADALHRYSVDHQRVVGNLGTQEEAIAALPNLRAARVAIGLVHVLALDLTISTYLARADPEDLVGKAEYELAEIVLRATQALASHYRRLG
jgi:hypothetical protein